MADVIGGGREDSQRLALQARILQSNAEEMRQQLLSIRQAAQEIAATIASLGALSSAREEALFPLGSGAFVKGKVTGDDVLVEAGARVVVEKPVEDAKALLNSRLAELDSASKRMEQELGAVLKRLDEVGMLLSREE